MSIALLIALALGVFTALTFLVLAERKNIQRAVTNPGDRVRQK
jgi:hypothetical protein